MKKKSLKFMIAIAGTLLFLNGSAYAATSDVSETYTESSSSVSLEDKQSSDSSMENIENIHKDSIEDISDNKTSVENFNTTTDSADTSNTNSDASDDEVISENTQTENSSDTKSDTTIEDTSNTSTVNTSDIALEEDTSASNTTSSSDDTTTNTSSESSDNTTIGNAKFINLNSIDNGSMTAEGQQRWYMTYAPAGKITVCLESISESSMDFNIHLFKYNTITGDISQVANSTYGAGAFEQLSYVSNEDSYYFIGVNTYSGYSADNSFALAVVYSDTYDSAENDDNFYERHVLNDIPDTITQTIDNPFDTDWTEFSLNENKGLAISFNNSGSKGTYVMNLYDANLNLIKSLTQGDSYNSTFAKGTYYMKVISQDADYDPSASYNINFVKYDDINTRKTVSSLPKNYKDSLNNQYDQKWIEYTANSDVTTVATLLNSNSSTNYILGVYTTDDSGNLSCQNVLAQNGHYKVSFKAGKTYYIGVISKDGTYSPTTQYTINFVPYNTSHTLLDMSNDGSYIITCDSNKKNLYINGNVVDLNWQRDDTTNYGGGCYEHLSQSISSTSTTEISGAAYGSYTASHYGTINHAVAVNAKNVNYFVYHYAYYNGQSPSDRYSDHMLLDFDQTLIIDADTCKAVDWYSSANFHYVNNQENHKFTQE